MARFSSWHPNATTQPNSLEELRQLLLANRSFTPVATLDYGEGNLAPIAQAITQAIRAGKRIALYADYDVDGTMSCVSWIWFLKEIGYSNFVHYIPCRFREGYGLNMDAIRHLIDDEKAEFIITMDTGITANEEAAYCRSRGVDFVCTDHHVVQPDKMPDCLILNPKLHPSPDYQMLCGCGITFVLLRRLASEFPVQPSLWTDLLALAGMATICDVVPLNPVNHRLARMGVNALARSGRAVIRHLLAACSTNEDISETDVGFRLGPRINAVGRLEHAHTVIEAFVSENPRSLVEQMTRCNEERKRIQAHIVREARNEAMKHPDSPILFLGGDWHPGVVGIAASKLVEEFWRPVWLFNRGDKRCKGSARSIRGFDVTAAMGHAKHLFASFGGHQAAGGYTFAPEHEETIRRLITHHGHVMRDKQPDLWESCLAYDCTLPSQLLGVELCDLLDELKPFGHGFEEPVFHVETEVVACQYYNDKQTGERRHTAITVDGRYGRPQKIMFFNEVIDSVEVGSRTAFLVQASRNVWRGTVSLNLVGRDLRAGGA